MTPAALGRMRSGDAEQAEFRADTWRLKASEAEDQGNTKRAAECMRKAQFWRDRFWRLTGGPK